MKVIWNVICWMLLHNSDSFNEFFRFLTIQCGTEPQDGVSDEHSLAKSYTSLTPRCEKVAKTKAIPSSRDGSFGTLDPLPVHLLQKIFGGTWKYMRLVCRLWGN